MIENHVALDAKALSLGVAPTERANATASVNALNAYLSSLAPAWNDTTQDTQASAASITGLWGDAAQTVALLQAAIQGLPGPAGTPGTNGRSEEHTSELQSLMRISYAVFCLKK